MTSQRRLERLIDNWIVQSLRRSWKVGGILLAVFLVSAILGAFVPWGDASPNTIWVAVTLGVAVLYVLLRHAYWNQAWLSWWDNLLSVILSFSLAVIAGLWLYNAQAEVERAERRQTHEALLEQEVLYILCNLGYADWTHVSLGDTTFYTWRTYVPTLASELCLRSGVFTDLESRLLVNLKSLADSYNWRTQNLEWLSMTAVDDEVKLRAVRNQDNLRRKILGYCNVVVKEISLKVDSVQLRECMQKAPPTI